LPLSGPSAALIGSRHDRLHAIFPFLGSQQWVKMAGDCSTQTEEEEAVGSRETASCVEDAAVGVWQAALWLRGVFARLWERGGIASLASFL